MRKRRDSKNTVLNVGFDLDGVLLYNPVRIARPIISYIKKKLLHKRKLKFYHPTSPLTRFLWILIHKSSIFIAPGLNDIKKLVREKKINAYIITARYKFLKDDLDQWIKKMEIDHCFSAIYYNEKDEQPHLYKERMIRKLKLDIFVEDNFDIVNYLKNCCQVFWIYNMFDIGINYAYKFPRLQAVVMEINKRLKHLRYI